MKTSELEGAKLDYSVAKALGGQQDGDGWRFDPPLVLGGEYGASCSFLKAKHSFSEDWSFGGPIIERESIAFAPVLDVDRDSTVWFAWHEGAHARGLEPADGYFERSTDWDHAHGSTPLIAAMRAFVASTFGDEVPDA